MAEISFNINGRQYPIACEDGQEEHLWIGGQRPVDRPGVGIPAEVAHDARQEQVDRHDQRQHGECEQDD